MRRWFRLEDRCPTCGHRFRREEGFFTGVMLVNFGTTLIVMWLFIVGWLIWHEATGSDAGLAPILGISLAIAVLLPIVFYPFASTLWAAMDLAMRPIEPVEVAEAETWLSSRPPGGPATR